MALRRPWKTREGGILIFYRSNFIKAEVRRKKSLLLYQEYYGKVLAFLFLYLKLGKLFSRRSREERSLARFPFIRKHAGILRLPGQAVFCLIQHFLLKIQALPQKELAKA